MKKIFEIIWFHEYLGVIYTEIFLTFSKGEDWISCSKIIENENDFLKILYDHGFLFCKIQEKIKIKLYSNLISIAHGN